ncbi:MAG: cytidylate kinase [Evtepia sp.]|nr:cytidylate kinase [Evtepia sp.]
MPFLSIAIDGPAGAGKSTLARRLAQEIDFLYVDTGAIYRTVGLFVEKNRKNCVDSNEVIPLLDKIQMRIAYAEDGLQHMYLQGEDVTEEIRHNRVSQYASQVSAIPEVRSFLIDMQRTLAKEHNVVMDGRDIGTIVLPKADLKIFLTASAEKRAKRRYQELLQKGSNLPFEQILEELIRRDEADMNRSVAPLRQAEDAVLLDTSDLDLEESFLALYAIVKEKFDL